MTSVIHHHSRFGGYQLGGNAILEPEFDDADALDLIEHVRLTGTLYSDDLGSGEPQLAGWYNPAPAQRQRYKKERHELTERQRRADEDRQRHTDELTEREERLHELTRQARQSKRAVQSYNPAFLDELTKRERVFRAEQLARLNREEIERRFEQDEARHIADVAEQERRAVLERKCWEIACQAQERWNASEIEGKLMWRMLRFMNLGAGVGKFLSVERFCELTNTLPADVSRCYHMLQNRFAQDTPEPDRMALWSHEISESL